MKTIVAMLLVSGDTVIGQLSKKTKKKTVLKQPVKLAQDGRGDRPLLFIRHNLLGFLPKVSYRNDTVVMIYETSPFVADFYRVAIKYLETKMQKHLETEFTEYTKMIDTANAKTSEPVASNEEFRQFVDDLEKAMEEPVPDTTLTSKKRTVH